MNIINGLIHCAKYLGAGVAFLFIFKRIVECCSRGESTSKAKEALKNYHSQVLNDYMNSTTLVHRLIEEKKSSEDSVTNVMKVLNDYYAFIDENKTTPTEGRKILVEFVYQMMDKTPQIRIHSNELLNKLLIIKDRRFDSDTETALLKGFTIFIKNSDSVEDPINNSTLKMINSLVLEGNFQREVLEALELALLTKKNNANNLEIIENINTALTTLSDKLKR